MTDTTRDTPWWDAARPADRRPILLARNRIQRAIRGWLDDLGFTEVDPAALGGNLGETNSVAFMFDRKGEIMYRPAAGDAETVMLAAIEAGAEDVESDEDGHWITCADTDLNEVATALSRYFPA